MDEVERLIGRTRLRSASSVLSKLDALLDLESCDDPRIVPFLLRCWRTGRATEVRIQVLKRLEKRTSATRSPSRSVARGDPS